MKKIIGGVLFISIILIIFSVLLYTNDTGITGYFINKGKSSLQTSLDKDNEVKSNNTGITHILSRENITSNNILELGKAGKEKISSFKKLKNMLFKPKFDLNIIQSIIQLREYSKSKDKLSIAIHINDLNNVITDYNDLITQESWKVILECVYTYCKDENYFNLIDSIVIKDDRKESELIHLIIQLSTLWNTQNTLLFSQVITNANNLIKELNDDKISDQWNSLIECDGNCNNFNDKLLSIINSISTI